MDGPRLEVMARVKYYSPKRRKIYAQGEDINCLDIFERDEWVCHICSGPVDRKVRFPDPMCATIDHIVPISAPDSPGHVKNNVATAHKACNEYKSDSVSVY